MELHYAHENFSDEVRLARLLSRERAKDTSLDYPNRDGDELARRYAERRGLDPLRPASEMVVRTEREDRAPGPERAAERVPEAPTPRRMAGALPWFLLTAALPWGGGTWLAGLAFGGRWNAVQAMMQDASPAQWDRMVRL